MCQLAEVGRVGFYRYVQRGSEAEEALALRSAIHDVVMEHRWRYGYRRVAEELRTQGWIVNHKRIARIMREDNLLTVQRDWFRPADHSLRAARIYLNLANRMSVLGPNQLWVADITYIRLTREFVYLAVETDIGYVGHPKLIRSEHTHSVRQVKINACRTKRVVSRPEPVPLDRQQIVFSHDSRYPLVIDNPPLGAELFCDPSVPVAPSMFHDNVMNSGTQG